MSSVGLVRIPRQLLHVQLDDLVELGVPERARAALMVLLADLPLVPDGSASAALIGPAEVTVACLAVLARHVGQGLRDHNLSLAHDRQQLQLTRAKLIFLEAPALEVALAGGDERPARETVLFVRGSSPAVLELLAQREAAGRASYITSTQPLAELAHWRQVRLSD